MLLLAGLILTRAIGPIRRRIDRSIDRAENARGTRARDRKRYRFRCNSPPLPSLPFSTEIRSMDGGGVNLEFKYRRESGNRLPPINKERDCARGSRKRSRFISEIPNAFHLIFREGKRGRREVIHRVNNRSPSRSTIRSTDSFSLLSISAAH